MSTQAARKEAKAQGISTSELEADYEKLSVRLKSKQEVYNDFCNQTGFLHQNNRMQTLGFSRSQAAAASHSARRYYNVWSSRTGVKSEIETLAKYYNIKYNDTEQYKLLQIYLHSINSGMLSPLAGFDKYREYHKFIENNIIGMTAADGTVIRAQSKHFLERVFGTKEDPKTGNPRSGVELEDILHTLKYGTPAKRVDSTKLIGSNCEVSLNPETGVLIQTNPKM